MNNMTPETNKIAPVRAKLKKLMEEKKRAKDDEGAKKDEKAPQELPKIQKVPHILLQDPQYFEKFYEPKWVSIGPIHHGKPKLKLAEEQYKLKLVVKFIQEYDGHEPDEALYGKIKENIKKLKNCFHEEIIKDYDDETLGSMLLLDGCFVLQFIHGFATNYGELNSLFKIKNDQIVFAQHDLFLLENQIPFLVLKLLMDSRDDRDKLKDSIKQFTRLYAKTPPQECGNESLEVDMDDSTSQVPAHLLDPLRLVLLQQSSKVTSNDGGEQRSLSNEVHDQEQSTCRKAIRSMITGVVNPFPKTILKGTWLKAHEAPGNSHIPLTFQKPSRSPSNKPAA